MDHAPLRPVPARPSGPIADADAVRTVSAVLPEIGAREGLALALVVLGGRERSEIAGRVGLDDAGLAEALAAARKALRRTVVALPGSGWCELTERLVSDRLDGALAERDAPRLDVHLRNCPRCVEHERRLVQATDALVGSVALGAAPPELAETPPAPGPPGPSAGEPPAPSAAEPPASSTEEPPSPSTEEAPSPSTEEPPGPSIEEPPASSTEEPPSPSTEEPPGPSIEERPGPSTEEPPGPSIEERPGPSIEERSGPSAAPGLAGQRVSEPAAKPAPGLAAEAAPPFAPSPPHPLRRAAVTLAWHVLFALAVLLAVAALALAVAGFLGAGL